MASLPTYEIDVASANSVTRNAAQESLSAQQLAQRACSELLRQAAIAAGLLDARDTASRDGIVSEQASAAIEQLLDNELTIQAPSETDCRRYYAAHQARYRTAERAKVRHILFAVTPGVDVAALRQRAQATLLELRCHDSHQAAAAFATAAREFSNCPSGVDGGELGWLSGADCAPELAREIFGKAEMGVLARLVSSRFGLHVVEVQQRQIGAPKLFEEVRGDVAASLQNMAYATAVRHYLARLAQTNSVTDAQPSAASTTALQ